MPKKLEAFVIPYLKGFFVVTVQSGHNIEKVREKMRELTKLIIHTYSAAKTFPYVLEALRSRNNRTRIECVDLVEYLLDNHGSEVSCNKISNFIVIFCFYYNFIFISSFN